MAQPPAPRTREPNPYETDAILARIPLILGKRPLVMGVVNVTPDSFSDGGQFLEAETAIRHGVNLVREGADILDVGGESTRPAATPVTEEEEIARRTGARIRRAHAPAMRADAPRRTPAPARMCGPLR